MCVGTCYSFAQQVLKLERDKTLGGNNIDQMRSVYETSTYDIIMGGTTQSPISGDLTDANNGGADYWVILLDSTTLIPKWNKTFGGSGDDFFSQMKLLSDGNYLLAGYSKSDASGDKTQDSNGGWDYWIVKIDINGNKLWDKTYGGLGDDVLLCVDESWDGGLILGGYSNSDISGDKTEDSYGGIDYWVIKTNASGNIQWDRTYGGSADDTLKSIVAHNVQQKYLLAGSSNSSISGNKSESNIGIVDYWTVQVDGNGDKLWDKTYGGFSSNVLSDAELGLIDMGYLLIGSSNSNISITKSEDSKGGYDYWLVNIDSSGKVLWNKTLGGGNDDYASAAILTIEGAHIVGGYSKSGASDDKTDASMGGFDYWFLKVDTNGAKVFDYAFGGFADDILLCLSQECGRGYYMGGESFSNDNGNKSETNRGVSDYWLLDIVSPTIPFFDYQIACIGNPILFFDLTEVLPDYWYWTFDDPASGADNSSYLKQPVHTFTLPGTYDVTLVVKEGCQNDTSITIPVEIAKNRLEDDIELGDDDILCEGEIMELSVLYDSTLTYIWSTGATTNSIFINAPDSFSVTVSDSMCSYTDGILIGECPRLYAPNIFSPDGDGENDYFFVYGVGITEIELTIFDRWGQKIFETKDMEQGWDGTFHGHKLPIDTYVYRVMYKGFGNTAFRKIGDISLIR